MHWRKKRLEPLIIDRIRKIASEDLEEMNEQWNEDASMNSDVSDEREADTLMPTVSSAALSCVCTPLVLTGAAGASAIVRDQEVDGKV